MKSSCMRLLEGKDVIVQADNSSLTIEMEVSMSQNEAYAEWQGRLATRMTQELSTGDSVISA